jgi:hypothetical protein
MISGIPADAMKERRTAWFVSGDAWQRRAGDLRLRADGELRTLWNGILGEERGDALLLQGL